MTNTADHRQLANIATEQLARIAAELASAQEDVALLARLSSAQDRVKALTNEHRKALALQQSATAAAAKEADAARFKDLQSINVTDKEPGHNLTGAPFEITYTRLTYSTDFGANVPVQATVIGFEALPDHVFDFLIDRHPENIPDRIASLAPGNPREAFRRYFLARRRGYMN